MSLANNEEGWGESILFEEQDALIMEETDDILK